MIGEEMASSKHQHNLHHHSKSKEFRKKSSRPNIERSLLLNQATQALLAHSSTHIAVMPSAIGGGYHGGALAISKGPRHASKSKNTSHQSQNQQQQ